MGSYIELPKSLQRQGLINIKNIDNYCFIWSYIRHINPLNKNPNRITKKDKELFNNIYEKLKYFEFPLKIDKNNIEKIEDILKINICILSADNNDNSIFPMFSSENNHKNDLFNFKHCETLLYSNQQTDCFGLSLQLEDRIERYSNDPAYITFKDHKENFNDKLQCRLINSAKNPIGRISKKILDSITSKVKTQTSLNLWKSTDEVINWFKTSVQKGNSRFIKFDICEFYPSITEELLRKALECVRSFAEISDEEADIIFHSKKSLLFHNNEVWTKTSNNTNFDVTMGSLDGAETCELVGLYLLNSLRKEIAQENVGLYRDDGLIIVRNANGHT